jgi:glycosyltransferase involved in cell wall biosynthesis
MENKSIILIDGTSINNKIDGLTQYILNVSYNLGKYHSDKFKFILLVRPNYCTSTWRKKLEQVSIKIIDFDVYPLGPIREFKFWFYLKYKFKLKYDLLYIPSNQYPIFLKGGIYTIHDLIYESFPQQLGKAAIIKRFYLHFCVTLGLKRSNKIIAVSNYTKDQIIKYFSIEPSKIDVIYEGWEHLTEYNTTNQHQFIKPFKNYFFYVGSSRGHKNLYNLLLAFQKINDDINWGLVISGNMDRLTSKEKALIISINKENEQIKFTGWINDEDLILYFGNANAFVFPSLSEGFGIPILESFYLKIPILCSNNTVFPEIAGNSAIYFDPFDIDSISSVLKDFKNDSFSKEELISNGTNRLELFSWYNTANKLVSLFNLSIPK